VRTIAEEKRVPLDEYFGGDEFVKCKLCTFKGGNLHTHIMYKHNMTVKKYKELFPRAETISEAMRKKLSKATKERIREGRCIRAPSKDPKIAKKIGKKLKGRKPTKEHIEKILETKKRNRENGYIPKRNPNAVINMTKTKRKKKNRKKQSRISKNLWKDPEYRSKTIEGNRRGHRTPEYRKKVSNRLTKNNPMKRPEVRKKVSRKLKKGYKDGRLIPPMLNPKIAHKVRLSLKIRPNNLEKLFIKFLEEYNLPFKYVGDGSLMVGNKNPDFIHKTKPKIIELFGDYWHKPEEEEKRTEFFKDHGYDCLVIWGHEIKKEDISCIYENILSFERS